MPKLGFWFSLEHDDVHLEVLTFTAQRDRIGTVKEANGPGRPSDGDEREQQQQDEQTT